MSEPLTQIIGVITGVSGFALSVYLVISQRRQDREGQIKNICDRLLQLEVKVGPWWSVMEKMALDILHHPELFERDALIDKYRSDEGLTLEEKKELLRLVWATCEDRKAPFPDQFAAMFMAANLRAQIEVEEGELCET